MANNVKLIIIGSIVTVIGLSLGLLATAAPTDAKNITSQDKKKLSETVIDLPDGDVRPILAVAASEGRATGRIVGKAAALISKQFGSGHVVMIKARKTDELVKGCPKIIATYYEQGSSDQYDIPFRVCPK